MKNANLELVKGLVLAMSVFVSLIMIFFSILGNSKTDFILWTIVFVVTVILIGALLIF